MAKRLGLFYTRSARVGSASARSLEFHALMQHLETPLPPATAGSKGRELYFHHHLLEFDNRLGLTIWHLRMAKSRFKARLSGKPVPLGGTRPHYWFRCNGRRFVFPYINKNACSAFKHFVADTSEFNTGQTLDTHKQKLDFINKYHQVCHLHEIDKKDLLVFVFRDPVERFVSLYKNKFIIRYGHEDIFRKIKSLSGQDPDFMSIRDLADFLQENHPGRKGRNSPMVDKHFFPQCQSLAPMKYHVAVPLKDLHPVTRTLFGEEVAAAYFARATNATHGATSDTPASNRPSIELRNNYLATGTLPSNAALLLPAVERIISRIYSSDFDMISKLSPSPTLRSLFEVKRPEEGRLRH